MKEQLQLRNFFSLEGPSGIGKTTIKSILTDMLKTDPDGLFNEIMHVQSPGSDPVAMEIRKIVKNPPSKIDGISSLLMFMAAQNNAYKYTISPFLDKDTDNLVISDRWTDSSCVYQCHFQKLALRTILDESQGTYYMPIPELTFILVCGEKDLYERRHGRIEDADDAVDMYESDSFLPIELRKYRELEGDLIKEYESSKMEFDHDRIHYIENDGTAEEAAIKIFNIIKAHKETK